MGTTVAPAEKTERLRIMSWNLWSKYGDWAARRDAIATTIADLDVDVCGLQEVWQDGDSNLAGELAELLGMHWTWVPALDGLGQQIRIGNAVLSRWPIGETETLPLPAPADRAEGRVILYAGIDTPNGRIPFFTTHTNAPFAQSAIRVSQIVAMTEFINRKSTVDYPPVITGDFNAEPDSDEIRLLLGKTSAPGMPERSFFDAWSFADGTSRPWTWDNTNPLVGKRGQPSTRIDYIFVGTTPTDIHRPAGPGQGHVTAAQVAGNHADQNGVWPSDHFAVVADLTLPDPAPDHQTTEPERRNNESDLLPVEG